MSVGINIYAEFGIPALTTKRISQDLFPLVGGTAGSQCFLGASFSGKSAGTLAAYSTIKGTGIDIGYSIVVDSGGNVYATGQYTSTTTVPINTFTTTPTASGFSLPIATYVGAFVIKWTSAGAVSAFTSLIRTGGIGAGDTTGFSITVDSGGNVYVTGQYNSTLAVPINTFTTTPTASGFSLPSTTGNTAFVIKWTSAGAVSAFTTLAGTTSGTDVRGLSIAVDSSGSVYITGRYQVGTGGLPIKTFTTTPTASGFSFPITSVVDVFVIKWTSAGTVSAFTNIQGINNTDIGYSIAVDSGGNVYVTGQYTSSATVPIKTFTTTPTASGFSLLGTINSDMFVIKWNADGTLAGYSTIAANGNDIGYSITVDSSGKIYVTGQYTSSATVPIKTFTTTPTASGFSLPITTGSDMFVIKWNADGTLAGFSTIKGSGTDIGQAITVDSSGKIYVTGQYTSTTTVPINTFGTVPTASGVSLPITTGSDMFVIKWNADGTLAGYSTLTGSGVDIGQAITVDSSGKIYVTGQYTSTTTVPINTFGTAPTATGVSLPSTTNNDMFVIKWNS